MGENSGDNSVVRALDMERAHDSDGDGDVNVVGDNDEEVLMKRMISNHPLFELLIDTHVDCLKVGLGHAFEDDEVVIATTDTLIDEANKGKLCASSTNIQTTPELDKFMEAYCMAIKKLKEAMEEPLKDASCFIANMYSQLSDLSVTEHGEVDGQTLVINHDKECEEQDLADD